MSVPISVEPPAPTPPRPDSGPRSPRQLAALVLSWVLAVVGTICASAAVWGVYTTLGISDPCTSALGEPDPTLAQRGLFALLAVLTLAGAALLARFGTALTPDRAGRRSTRLVALSLILAVIPLSPTGAIPVPYGAGLALRAGRRGRVAMRWTLIAVATVIGTLSFSFWADASGCL